MGIIHMLRPISWSMFHICDTSCLSCIACAPFFMIFLDNFRFLWIIITKCIFLTPGLHKTILVSNLIKKISHLFKTLKRPGNSGLFCYSAPLEIWVLDKKARFFNHGSKKEWKHYWFDLNAFEVGIISPSLSRKAFMPMTFCLAVIF